MKKDGFIIYTSWLEAIESLSDEDAGILFKSIVRFAKTGIKPEFLPDVLSFPFNLFASRIEIDNSRYEEVSQKRRKSIKKRWERESIQVNTNEYKSIQTNTNDTDRIGKDRIGKDRIEESSPNVDDSLVISSSLHSEDNILRDAYASTTSLQDDASNSADIKLQIVDFWNRTMDGKAIPKVNGIRERREASLFARLRVYGIDAVYTVITKAAASSFLNGGGAKSFIANFDWVFRPNNFPKVLEGNYDDNDKPQANMNYGTTRQQRDDADRRQRAQAYATLDDYLINGSTVGR